MAFGACTGTDLIAGFADWVSVYTPFAATSGHVTMDDPSFAMFETGGGGYFSTLEIDATMDWTFTCTFQYEDELNIDVGIGGLGGGIDELRWAAVGSEDWYLTTGGDDDGYALYSEAFDASVDIDLELVWEQATTTLTATLTQGAHVETLTSVDPYAALVDPPVYPFVLSVFATEASSIDFTYFCVGAADVVVDPDIIGAFTGHVSSIPEITGSIASIPQFTGIITTRGTP
jgi:hypothetical protein